MIGERLPGRDFLAEGELVESGLDDLFDDGIVIGTEEGSAVNSHDGGYGWGPADKFMGLHWLTNWWEEDIWSWCDHTALKFGVVSNALLVVKDRGFGGRVDDVYLANIHWSNCTEKFPRWASDSRLFN